MEAGNKRKGSEEKVNNENILVTPRSIRDRYANLAGKWPSQSCKAGERKWWRRRGSDGGGVVSGGASGIGGSGKEKAEEQDGAKKEVVAKEKKASGRDEKTGHWRGSDKHGKGTQKKMKATKKRKEEDQEGRRWNG
ncbi:hypothetical protein OS493_019023 [Desmophyllum pertusum]|uniref:Uncharacterized protein n=1 Tax=Desmophyllum pertusum TaxID=174260 RepID=A0A9W9Z1A9_9CNID|nr:hypothetical protein OS493_019023 [Desmophyllum pertusum]